MPKIKVEIIYQDSDIAVINKPSGLSVTKDRTGAPELVEIMSGQMDPEPTGRLRLVHRIDKDTSGVMMLALNRQALRRFAGYFEKKLVRKTYLALAAGLVGAPEGRIELALSHSRKKGRLMQVDRKKGKKALTTWRLLADFGPVCLLAVSPVTGRTHQIRVHLNAVGLPLVIDPLYGNSEPMFLSDFKANYRLGKGKTEQPLIDRLTLHSYQMEILESQEEDRALFIAGLDKKFAAALKMLTKHNPKGVKAFVNSADFSKIINAQRL